LLRNSFNQSKYLDHTVCQCSQ